MYIYPTRSLCLPRKDELYRTSFALSTGEKLVHRNRAHYVIKRKSSQMTYKTAFYSEIDFNRSAAEIGKETTVETMNQEHFSACFESCIKNQFLFSAILWPELTNRTYNSYQLRFFCYRQVKASNLWFEPLI